ncbi:hypothetical protein LWI29_026161 [Acer saccharum]|uniref:Uncharacterized protein n=1 Tax=Acer saccharum TaxID=4024 RepID=A0AA39T3G8_ACESA|nr:hypothetical protein LWI29_026161 [Acer saccharum]
MKPDHLQAALDGNGAASPFCYIDDPTKSDIFHKVSPSGNSLLHVAASRGHINIIELMKPRFPDLILMKNSKGDTALHVAVRAGDLKTVTKLIECPEEIPSSSSTNYYESLLKMKNNGGNTALHEAVLVLVESKKSVDTLVSVAHSWACCCADREGGAAGASAGGSAAGALSDDMAVGATLLLPTGSVTESRLLSAASVAAGGDAAVGDKDSDGDTAGARELWRGA